MNFLVILIIMFNKIIGLNFSSPLVDAWEFFLKKFLISFSHEVIINKEWIKCGCWIFAPCLFRQNFNTQKRGPQVHSLIRYKQHFLLLVSYKTSGSWIHDFSLHLALTKRGGANWDFELKPDSPSPFCLPLGFLGINCDISLLAQDGKVGLGVVTDHCNCVIDGSDMNTVSRALSSLTFQ